MYTKNASLSDEAYNYILNKIIFFEYTPNEPIIESDICEELGISRTPLREALRRLEAEGLVIKARNRGTFVRSYTQQDIAESCDIRILFELYALKNCIQRVSHSELEEIRRRVYELTEESSPESFYEVDADLHGMIARYCGNSRMWMILQSMSAQLDAVQKVSAQTPNRLLKSRAEHLEIVDAIFRKDEQEASEKLKLHLENVKKSFTRSFEEMRLARLDNQMQASTKKK